MEQVVKRSARGIVIDDQGCVVLVRRTKPGMEPYWTAPGGGVDAEDSSVEAALVRELREELGAEVVSLQQVFLFTSPVGNGGVGVQHFFVCRLRELDLSNRSGPELEDPARGGYEVDRVVLAGDELERIDLKPAELRAYVLANRAALLDAAGVVAT